MPKVTKVAKSRKVFKCSKCGIKIKKGSPYRWWKFNFGPRYNRCMQPACDPKPSDLTRSEYLGQIGNLQKEGFCADSLEGLQSERDDVVEKLNEIAGDCDDKYNNMPTSLQSGDTGCLLQERSESCRNAASALQAVDIPEPTAPALSDDEEAENADESALESARDNLIEILADL